MAYAISALLLAIISISTFVWAPWDVSQSASNIRAQNFIVLRNAAHEAINIAGIKANSLPLDTVWIPDTRCKTPLDTTDCTIAVDSDFISAYTPEFWIALQNPQDATPRWKIHIANSRSYVYGAVTADEMRSIRELSRHSPTISLCSPSRLKRGLTSDSLLDSLSDSLPDSLKDTKTNLLTCSPALKADEFTPFGDKNTLIPFDASEMDSLADSVGIVVSVGVLPK